MAEMTVRIEGDVPTTPSGTQDVNIVSSGNLTTIPAFPTATSLHVAGSAANVTAGQAICTLSAPPAGTYMVEVHRMAGGSGTPTLFNNGAFMVGATSYVLPSVAVLEVPYTYTFYVTLNGSTALSVNAVSAGAANITIAASITATRIK